MASSTLLRQGTVLTHVTDDHVVPLPSTDVLIKGNVIVEIGQNLTAPDDGKTEVIECQGKIISPGLVDTHHHLWQTQLKGRHAEHALVSYFVEGYMMGYTFTPEDVYWGQLSGSLEAMHAGTTTVLDHAHMTYSAEHASAALRASADSGIRTIFAYSMPVRVAQWDQSTCSSDQDLLPEWSLTQVGELAGKYNQDPSSLIEVGLGFDFWFLPKEMVLGTFQTLRKAGVRLVTTHVCRNSFSGLQSPIPMFESYGLLRPPYSRSDHEHDQGQPLPFLLLSHCNNIHESDLSRVAKTGTPISSTPDTEAQMSLGYPVALHESFISERNQANTSLGIDCHTNNPSSIILQARALLNLTRVQNNQHILDANQFPKDSVKSTSEEAFNLATIRGARCLGLEGEIGSIEIGKKADIIIFDAANSVGMLAAAEFDPVVAVLRFSESADIEYVIVDGKIRKRNGKLVNVGVGGAGVDTGSKTSLTWSQVAEQVRKSKREIQKRVDNVSLAKGREMILNTFYVDQSTLVDGTI